MLIWIFDGLFARLPNENETWVGEGTVEYKTNKNLNSKASPFEEAKNWKLTNDWVTKQFCADGNDTSGKATKMF